MSIVDSKLYFNDINTATFYIAKHCGYVERFAFKP